MRAILRAIFGTPIPDPTPHIVADGPLRMLDETTARILAGTDARVADSADGIASLYATRRDARRAH